MPAAIILAAGRSSRMGFPKALLPYRGQGFLERLMDVYREHCAPVVVVLGHHAEAVSAAVRPPDRVLFTVNADYDRGQLSSLQQGLRQLPPDAEAFLFTPVDYPAVRGETVAALANAWRDTRARLILPHFEGRRGHPVCCARELAGEFLALDPCEQARTVVHRHLHEALLLQVADPGVTEDIDDPAAYHRLLARAEERA